MKYKQWCDRASCNLLLCGRTQIVSFYKQRTQVMASCDQRDDDDHDDHGHEDDDDDLVDEGGD